MESWSSWSATYVFYNIYWCTFMNILEPVTLPKSHKHSDLFKPFKQFWWKKKKTNYVKTSLSKISNVFKKCTVFLKLQHQQNLFLKAHWEYFNIWDVPKERKVNLHVQNNVFYVLYSMSWENRNKELTDKLLLFCGTSHFSILSMMVQKLVLFLF